MDDMKKGYREAEETSKEAWRNRDGESVTDALGNAGDDMRKNLGDLGDDAREEADKSHTSDTDLDAPNDTGTTDRRY